MRSVCFYGLGGGLGHTTRLLALGQALEQLQPDLQVDYILPSRSQGLPMLQDKSVHVPPFEVQDEPRMLAGWLDKLWLAHTPELLVVDVFPRGILAEFMDCRRFPPQAVLLTRLCRQGYYENRQMLPALKRYREIYWTENFPPPPILQGAREVGPVTLFSRGALLKPEAARDQLGLGSPGEVGLLVLRAGPAEEQRQLLSAVRSLRPLDAIPARDREWDLEPAPSQRLRVVWADHEQPEKMPLFPFYPGADLIVSAAGYHSLYELLQLQIPTIFWPQRRLYDDQMMRLQKLEVGRQPKRWVVQSEHEFHKAFEEFEKLRSTISFRRGARESDYQGAHRLAKALLQKGQEL